MIAITGGAGFIGSSLSDMLVQLDIQHLVIDSLATGDANRLQSDIEFYKVDILNTSKITSIFLRRNVSLVIHLAGLKNATDSESLMGEYRSVNIRGTESILMAMQRANVKDIIFSSTAAVYGNSTRLDGATELDKLSPINFYAKTKISNEQKIVDNCKINGSRAIIFRYFNVIGAVRPSLFDLNDTSVVPKIFESIRTKKPFKIYGRDYETIDGTTVRDFLDIRDLIEAHIIAIQKIRLFRVSNYEIINLGTGTGTSILQLFSQAKSVIGHDLHLEFEPRRPNDPEYSIANTIKAQQLLDWHPKYSLRESLLTLNNLLS